MAATPPQLAPLRSAPRYAPKTSFTPNVKRN